jgi:type I restriction enzyme, S subunit
MSVREGYKQTEIGVIPEKWESKVLSKIVNLIHGYQFRTTDFTEDGVAVIKIGNVNGTTLNLENLSYIASNRYEEFQQYAIQNNDILMSLTGNIGRVVEVQNIPFSLLQNYRVGKFEPISENQVFKNFLKYLLSSPIVLDRLEKLSNQSAQANFGKQDMDKIIVPLPPLQEQQKIAEILSTVDQKIDSINSKIEETQTLKRGLMQRLLSEGIGHSEFKESEIGRIPMGWEVKPIGEIAKVIRGASPRPKGDPKYYGGTVPRLMGTDVTRDGKYVIPTKDFLTEEGAKKSRFLPKGTLTVVCSGTVGVPAILGIDACIHDGFLALVDLKDNINIEYLYYLFSTLQEKFDNSATHGGVFTNLTTSIIKEFTIPVPPLEEQIKITEIFSITDEKLNALQAKREAFETLKKGLMQKLLSGEVRVNGLIPSSSPHENGRG